MQKVNQSASSDGSYPIETLRAGEVFGSPVIRITAVGISARAAEEQFLICDFASQTLLQTGQMEPSFASFLVVFSRSRCQSRRRPGCVGDHVLVLHVAGLTTIDAEAQYLASLGAKLGVTLLAVFEFLLAVFGHAGTPWVMDEKNAAEF
jgi:hypothetical protein